MGKWRKNSKKVHSNWANSTRNREDAAGSKSAPEETVRSTASYDLDELKASAAWGQRFECMAPKRKYALCFGYLGSNYHGLQANPDTPSVEREVERALLLAGGVQEANFGSLHKIQWTRAARTDAGVHANAQCVAMRLQLPISGQESMICYKDGEAQPAIKAAELAAAVVPEGNMVPVEDSGSKFERQVEGEVRRQRMAFIARVNSFLPVDMRVHTMTKVSKAFNAKNMCGKRRYHYMLPTFMIRDRKEVLAALSALYEEQGPSKELAKEGGYALPHQNNYLGKENAQRAHESDTFRGYRATPEALQGLQQACKMFEGTHKFHNYTTGKTPLDASSSRYIMSFDTSAPVVSEKTGVEWVLCTIIGQSFLLNQIRRMVGMCCEVASGATPAETLTRTLSSSKVEVPMLPGLGLYLDELFFDGYNSKQGKDNVKDAKRAKAVKVAAAEAAAAAAAAAGDENAAAATAAPAAAGAEEEDANVHESIDWSVDPYCLRVYQEFRDDTIWPHIFAQEASTSAYVFYLDSMRVHVRKYISFDFFSKPSITNGTIGLAAAAPAPTSGEAAAAAEAHSPMDETGGVDVATAAEK